jgi:5-deoxy-glucuronate isomerase
MKPSTGQLRLLSFGILSLQKGETWEKEFDAEEAALVIWGGRCEIRAGEERWLEAGERKDVFSGRASALYLPAGSRLAIRAKSELEAAVITAPAANPATAAEAVLVRPEEVKVRTVGRDNWRRSVQDIIDRRIPAQRLLVGETYNEPGGWSSYPPHKHDTEIPGEESAQEEIYHFRVNPSQGFGIQRIYSPENGFDQAYVVRNGDTMEIPFGYHPLAAAPECRVYYLWALAGETRELRVREDPACSRQR